MIEALSINNLTMDQLLSAICSILKFDAASIYSISHTLESISCEASTLQHLYGNEPSPLSDGFLSQIVKHKRSIFIADVNDTHFQFDPQIDDRFVNPKSEDIESRRTKAVYLEPLFNDNKEMVGILEMVHCSDKTEELEYEQFKSVLQFSRNIASVLLSTELIKRELEHSNTHKKALLELAKVMSNSNGGTKNNIESFIERVRKTVYKSIHCDKVAVFMVDEMTKELWCKASDDVEGLRLPLSAGVVGHAVTTGQTLNIHDAYKVELKW